MKMIPEYVKTNLVHGIHYVLQAQTNSDDGSILTNMRKMYLALQPTRILAQNAQQGVPQSALDDMQGSLQLWLESQIVQKVDAVIDLLAKSAGRTECLQRYVGGQPHGPCVCRPGEDHRLHRATF